MSAQSKFVGLSSNIIYIFYIHFTIFRSAMIVERSKKYETDLSRGTLQATGYLVRFFGSMFGALFGSLFYNQDDWGWGLPIYG